MKKKADFLELFAVEKPIIGVQTFRSDSPRIYHKTEQGIAICRIINQFDDDNSRNGATERIRPL